jgi:single-stranded-DNA-specific exonuclease
MLSVTPRQQTCDADFNWPETLHPLLKRIYSTRLRHHFDEVSLDLSQLLPPDRLKNTGVAAELLATAIRNKKRILICGDFDVDGATSSALAVRGLRMLGAASVDFLVPNRFEYGYGLSPRLVDEAAKYSPDLIVTVDNGISSIEGVQHARQLGIDVLVTDHHLAGDVLPDANVIVNPNQPGDSFPSKNLAGVGVMFYVLLALRRQLRESGYFTEQGISEPNLAELLDLVALGTVADVVPLDRNNRILVREGLRRIRVGKCVAGISALLAVSGRNPSSVNAADLGFAVGPRLNAAGRLDDMSIGIACLLSDHPGDAYSLAAQLDSFNRDRKAIENDMRLQAFDLLDQIGEIEGQVHGLALFNEDWHQGVIGILASRVKEKINRPVVIFAPGDANEIRGSARSIAGIHIRDVFAAIDARKPGLLLKFGGHAMAAGLTVVREGLQLFQQLFDEEVRRIATAEMLEKNILTDGELAAADMTLQTWQLLEDAGPWGQGFPEPLFSGRFRVVSQRILKDRHYKLVLEPQSGEAVAVDGIAFNQLEGTESPSDCQLPDELELTYRLALNEYNGQRNLQLMIDTILTP